ncbi:hypothetical protein [Devosia faecipullorum]|uniref:hypothetical protein n=1 Tax=Devosia faecipullorum TaxID=2755039 RepID=UPI00187B6201|nr:hypothetical protein [Devosia faecipullorum]MBE7731793.1 hypothetical protein [Devosia faecipullorum]
MKHHFALLASVLAIGLGASMTNAQSLELNTYMIAWGAENCESFDYPEDLQRHATMDVLQSPAHEVTDMQAKMDFALDGFENNIEELCEFLPYMLEEDEEE